MSQRRVVEQHPHSLEAQLLRAGQAVQAPDATLRVTLSALGLGATAATSVSGAAQAKAWGWFGTVSAKWTAIVILAASGAYVATRVPAWLSVRSAAGVPSTSRQSPAPLTPLDLPEQPQRAHAAVTASRTDSPSAATVAEPLAPQKPSARLTTKAVALAVPRENLPAAANFGESLGAEVALIDAARRAVDAKQGSQALALLQQHDQQFKTPRLAQEAALLRTRALEQTAHGNEAKGAAAVRGSPAQNQPVEPH